MGVKRTIFAGLGFACTLLILWGDWKWTEVRERRRALAVRLIPGSKEEITGLTIERSGASLALVKDADQWKLKSPMQDEADEESVKALLETLDKQTKSDPQRMNTDELKAYGLAQPPVAVTVETQKNHAPVKLMIGGDSPVGGEVYARLEGSGECFTVSAALPDQLQRPLLHFRNKEILTVQATQAKSLTLTHGGSTFEAAKEDNQWRLQKPIQAQADAEQINGLLRELQTTRAMDFVDSPTLELSRFGLDSPTVAVIVALGGDGAQSSTLLIGNRREGEPPAYYATCREKKRIFLVPQSLFAKLQPTVFDLQSKQIFTLAREEIAHFEVEFGNQTTKLSKDTGGVWHFDDDPSTKVDQELVNSLTGRLPRMKIAQFFSLQPLAEQSGLDSPYARVKVADSSGAKAEGIETGRPVEGKDLVYARMIGGKDTFAVAGDQPGRFFHIREDFLDKTLFAFPTDQVASIVVSEKGHRWTFRVQEDAWVGLAEGNPKPYQVKGSVIERLVLSALDLKWKRKLNPADSADQRIIALRNLASPDRVIRILDARGAELAVIGQAGEEDTRVYIRRGEKDYFSVEKSVYEPFLKALKELLPPA